MAIRLKDFATAAVAVVEFKTLAFVPGRGGFHDD